MARRARLARSFPEARATPANRRELIPRDELEKSHSSPRHGTTPADIKGVGSVDACERLGPAGLDGF